MFVKSIYVYPIKGLPALSLKKSLLESTGLSYDRNWILLDEKGQMLSLRNCTKLQGFKLSLKEDYLEVIYPQFPPITIPLTTISFKEKIFEIWGEKVVGLEESSVINDWFSQALGQKCTLVRKKSAGRLAAKGYELSMVDSSPLLLVAQASVDKLSQRIGVEINPLRFRPNIIVTELSAHEEDTIQVCTIGALELEKVKLCARCQVVNIPLEIAGPSNVLATLVQYRKQGNKVLFGTYMRVKSTSPSVQIQVGDPLKILSRE